ncbi:LamG domain-containing protein [Rhizomicrobium electricum]|uniref:LamG domain-containing protein n=1 Tax=Rhizomicrobium electricum TaxID=480070 RepID=A0ABP3PI92_9PROT|nr:LamG domain-containing protein [Rhizomicrobium electricum]NIJ48470.1 hypothetical protein [Rhizomicrobium electricum]
MKKKSARQLVTAILLSASALAPAAGDSAGTKDGLLFYLSGAKGFDADVASGDPSPNFIDKTAIASDPKAGPFIRSEGEQLLAWHAGGNIYAQRGTLAFRFRPREPLGEMQFPLWRVSYADHTSWDMDFLRIDWNGHGIDAFVTDNNLARLRVSYRMDTVPAPDQWIDITFTWDETAGVKLYVGGKLVAEKIQTAVLDAGLDQFGPFHRTISPMQVQSQYQYVRGGDIDEIRIYDHAISSDGVAALEAGRPLTADATPARSLADPRFRQEWLTRYGWTNEPPVVLSAPQTAIRKVEVTAAWDIKERMMGASDGMAETTWPGVYNRSKLPGRHDYFELPDWNVYAEGGKAITFDLPNEAWNHIEFTGAASGTLTAINSTGEEKLGDRPQGLERNAYQFAARSGGHLRFNNAVQETPIQELGFYNIVPGAEPQNETKLSYTVRASAEPDTYASTSELRRFIDARYVADERETVVALPDGAPSRKRAPAAGRYQPIAHILIPSDFRNGRGGAPSKFSYTWENMDAGLDGIALDIPALKVKPLKDGLFPLNIRVMDPIWPGRTLMDVNVSVKPGEARTLWLDTRDRLLPPHTSLYLTVAGGGGDFSAASLDGMKVRLVMKPRAAALAEHIADRWAQVRDNMAFVVEEHTNDRRLSRYERMEREFQSLFAADPEHTQGRLYWAELNPEQGWPAFKQPTPPKGVPLWAFRQTEDLKLVRRFIEWWIDHRQSDYGDFGGGISDDTDLTQQWPPLAAMGVIPDKVRNSLRALTDAVDKNGMITNGLNTILTDYLHTYEEGINARGEDAYLNDGDPKSFERLMQTARAYPKIIETNKSGHTGFVSQAFSATRVVREGPWGWEHPYSYIFLQPGMQLVNFNGNPALKKLILDIADSYIAYGKKNADGSMCFPEFFNLATDQTKGCLSPSTRGLYGATQLFWAAYSWTGDKKYLAPLESFMGPGLHLAVRGINANALPLMGKTEAWGKDILDYVAKLPRSSTESRSFTAARDDGSMPIEMYRYVGWLLSGDKKYLEDIYGDEIQTANQRMYMVTEGHWWSDRVELYSDLLQRTRLGGIVVRRNQVFQGNLVSWRFAGPTDAEQVGILVGGAMPDRFTVEAYNLAAKPIKAAMTGWMIAPGTWKMSGAGIAPKTFKFERATSVDLVFAPRKTTMLTFERVEAGPSTADRPDLGIGEDDVVLTADTVEVTVHSLGAKPAEGGKIELLDAKGKVVATAPVPALAAPTDLLPKTAKVTLPRKAGAASVRVVMSTPEITLLNNQVRVPAAKH